MHITPDTYRQLKKQIQQIWKGSESELEAQYVESLIWTNLTTREQNEYIKEFEAWWDSWHVVMD